jgi:hypothetical protein
MLSNRFYEASPTIKLGMRKRIDSESQVENRIDNSGHADVCAGLFRF